jgi:hypothetical protein
MKEVIYYLYKYIWDLAGESFTADVLTGKASPQASSRSLKTPFSKGSNDLVVAKTLVLYYLLNIIFKYIKINLLHLDLKTWDPRNFLRPGRNLARLVLLNRAREGRYNDIKVIKIWRCLGMKGCTWK